jgi:hypothetical protein
MEGARRELLSESRQDTFCLILRRYFSFSPNSALLLSGNNQSPYCQEYDHYEIEAGLNGGDFN